MKQNFPQHIIVAALLGMLAFQRTAVAQRGVDQAVSDAVDAYIYGYPLVMMDMTRKQLTNVKVPDVARAPMGQFIRLRTYPPVDYRAVVFPNADTLYITAWLDVSKEPWVVNIPDMGNRYYMLPMLDGWTTVFQVPGTRTTGEKTQKYVITGPGWTGGVPAGVTEYKSPTGLVWILGRIYCTGTPADYAAVHALQDKITVVPLSSYGKPYTPVPTDADARLDMKTATRDQVNSMGVDEFFNYLAMLLKTNPPAPEDASILPKLKAIGVEPGQEFVPSKLRALDKEAIKGVPKLAQMKLVKYYKDEPKINGWWSSTNMGSYGTDYLRRAMTAMFAIGANLPQDAIYPIAMQDADGKELDASSNKYVMHFDKGQLPPVKGFWSLTMYDEALFFVPNSINRYTLSQRDKLLTNPDRSVDLYLQAESPGKAKEANWLPAPKAKFVPMLRLYWAKDTPPSILDGTWKPPAIKVSQ
ncbi:MAG: DUF1254 domain-containing protein [Candidatus Udaeobacter sp.]